MTEVPGIMGSPGMKGNTELRLDEDVQKTGAAVYGRTHAGSSTGQASDGEEGTAVSLSPFALALKATVFQIGLLSSIPNLTMALSQLCAPQLAERVGSCKGLILPVVFLHASMWLPILLVPFLSFPGHKISWLIGFLTLITVLGSCKLLSDPSLMARVDYT